MEIQIGKIMQQQTIVDKTNIASALASGDLEVFSTPSMIALMEHAADRCLAEFLEEGQSSVGSKVDIEHTAATPMGMKVTAYAEIMGFEGRRVDFKVWAEDECGPIGQGNHTRFIINSERFLQKVNSKKA